MAFSVMVGGAVGAVFWNIVLKRSYRFKRILVTNAWLAVLGVLLFLGLLFTNNEWILMIATFTCGFSLCPFFPLSLEYGCELIFPIGEGSAAGFLLASIHIFGLVQVLINFFLLLKNYRE